MRHYFVYLLIITVLISLASEFNTDCPDPTNPECPDNDSCLVFPDRCMPITGNRISKDSIHISWNAGSDIPVGLGWTAASVLDKQIYVCGGISTVTGASNLLQIYDPELDTWTIADNKLQSYRWETLAPMPTARIFMGVCVVEDTIYAIGGGSKYPFAGVTTIEAFNIAENSWKKKAALKIGLGDLKACLVDGKIFLTGGWLIWGDSSTSTVQVYDPKVDSVYMATDMQFAKGASSTLSINDKIYVISGLLTVNPEYSFTSKTEIGIPEF